MQYTQTNLLIWTEVGWEGGGGGGGEGGLGGGDCSFCSLKYEKKQLLN